MSNADTPSKGETPPQGRSSGENEISTPSVPAGSGCASLAGLLFVIIGFIMVASGSSDGAKNTCARYPDDGYCSFNELLSGGGWLLVVVGVAAFISQARAANRTKPKDGQ